VNHPPAGSERTCPQCSAPQRGGVECWLCGGSLKEEQGQRESPPESGRPARPDLAFLYVALAVILVLVGAVVSTPGILALVLIVALPALLRVVLARRAEQSAPARRRLFEVLGSVGVVASIILALAAGLLTACGTLR